MSKRNPSESLPKMPNGATYRNGGFGSYRQELNARARLAGYKNYYEWQESRRKAGVPRKNEARSKPKPKEREFKSGKKAGIYIFRFYSEKGGKEHYTKRLYDSRSRQIDNLINTLPANWIFQIHIQANIYGGADVGDKPEDWPWASMYPMDVELFRRALRAYGVEGATAIDMIREHFNVKDFSRGNRGIRQIHITVTER